jgi:hypothetical protein
MMKNNYFKKVFGILMVMIIIACGITLFDQVILDELEDLFPDHGVFDPGDFILGMTCELSLIYSMIRILENIFRKEENK